MYLPTSFEVNDRDVLHNMIREHSFGILFSQTEQGPYATHLPFLLEESATGDVKLLGHFAKANPHWKQLNGQNVLVAFTGPHAYISPTWYGEPNTVPTWNYVAVHVYGELELVEEPNELKQILETTTAVYESEMEQPWQPDLNAEWMEPLMKGIVGFRINVRKMEGKWKLNQNHSLTRQENAIAGLRQTNAYDSQKIADLMEQNVQTKRKQQEEV